MIVSIGVDIVEIDEIKASILKSKRFIERVFTKLEREYCESKENKFQHYAVRFAAKEAVMKALKTGWDKGVQWKQIEIKNNSKGVPDIILSGKARKLMQDLHVEKIDVSLSHSRKTAIAMIIMESYTEDETSFYYNLLNRLNI